MSHYTIDPILKHLLRGAIKSIPFAGSLIEELIYGPLDDNKRQNEARELYSVLNQIKGKIKTLEEVVILISNSKLNYNIEINNRLQLLTSSISSAKKENYKDVNFAIVQAYRNSLIRTPLNAYLADLSNEIRLWRGLSITSPVGIEDVYVSTTVSSFENNQRKNIEISNTLDNLLEKQSGKRHFIIQGSPGSGKSTLLHHLANTHIDFFNKLSSKKLPILLHLPAVEHLCVDAGDWNISITDVVIKRASHIGDSSYSNELNLIISNVIHSGDALIFLDAVDEVSYKNRLRIKNWLEAVYKTADQCNIIITSRPISILNSLHGFHALRVEPLDSDKQDSYIDRWFKCNNKPTLAEKMIEYLEFPENFVIRGVSELAGNPLFLTMMCIEYMRYEKISRTPAALIDNFTRYLLKELDEERGIQHSHSRHNIGLDLSRKILELIASDYFEKNETSFTLDSLVFKLNKLLQEQGIQIPIPLEEVLDDLALESGLLRKDWHGEWHFSHYLFQEFFTARYHWRKQYEEDIDQTEWLNRIWFDENIDHYENVKRFYTELARRNEAKE
ncbi:MAG: NACHT domain-containing protein [Candidatus Thiodiazotropha sp. (ex Dulcina madagascariensis)]|nr:NACHT domain-containing protein [Candidatus Thiodiazotropha sp. (ex Dulcina madagascariensis)]